MRISRLLPDFKPTISASLAQKTFESQGVRKDGQVFPIDLSVSFWKTLARRSVRRHNPRYNAAQIDRRLFAQE